MRIAELQNKLEQLDERFRTEAQRRGFDPAQVENMALPTALAKLFAERAQVASELEELAGEHDSASD